MNWIGKTAAYGTVAMVLAGLALPGSASSDWPVFGHDSARSGYAVGDNAISLANVGLLHRRWVAKFDAPGDGAPILVSNLPVTVNHARPLIFQSTRMGTTYAIDAYKGTVVWKQTTQGLRFTTSVPAEDPSGQWIYAPGIDAFVHKYSLADGTEFHGGAFPLRITWSQHVEKLASALNVANGYLYVATGSYLDNGQYVGHVITLRLQDGQVNVINALCSNIHQLIRIPNDCPMTLRGRAGIWARGGVVVDPDPSMGGRVYVATANGPFDADQGGNNYGDSVLAISGDGSAILDSFTPTNFKRLWLSDMDIGSTAPVLLPQQPTSNTPLMAVQGGKDGILRLLNRQKLGGVGGELQDLQLPDEIISAPATWIDPSGASWVFVGTLHWVTALRVETNSGTSELNFVWHARIQGTSPIVANGIVYAARNNVIDARNALDGHLVWSSAWESAGGTIGDVHWESPIVANGWLYISDENSNLTAYSL